MVMTFEEHEARAMLLGRRYSEWAGAYVNDRATVGPEAPPWLDAETLEELHHDEKFARIQQQLNTEADTR